MKALSLFDMKNLPLVLDVVLPLWTVPQYGKDFAQLHVEYIVRNNIYSNDLAFQLEDGGEFCSAAFFARKGEHCDAQSWLSAHSEGVTEKQKNVLRMSQTYIEAMDRRTLAFMGEGAVKLSLFVSRKSGYGSAILAATEEKLRAAGYAEIYLWTDCDCNWQWYERHGFTLVWQGIYEAFSEPGDEYRTFIFKKKFA